MQVLAASFFLQMAVILLTCRLVGMLAKKVGQPQVVGEMIAGVLLGPSLLGLFFPDLMSQLFTKESRSILFVGSQLGVGLYMFLVGMEFKTELFRSRARSAASVSIAGMVVPFILGAILAPWLVKVPGIFSANVKIYEAGLFLGAAIAITAFPMLARIIYERGLSGTSLGTLALAAGAIDDAAAWCVLAIVLASFGAGSAHFLGMEVNPAVLAIGGGAFYAIFMLTIGKKLLARLGTWAERDGTVSPALMAVVLMLFCLSAWFTDHIGIHAVFGGFVLGIAMPRGVLTEDVTRKLEPFTVIFLLPMFFTFSGLSTKLNMLVDPTLLIIAVVILLGGVSTGRLIAVAVVLAFGCTFVLVLWERRPREWPWDASSPTAGVLARENTSRNPGRTAVTSAALMIGVALIVFVAVFVNGFKDSFLGAIDRSITSDMIIQGQNFQSIPAPVVAAAGKVPGVQTASGIQFTEAQINNGGTDSVNGVDPATFSNVYKFDWLDGGSDKLLHNLGADQALIEEQFAKSHDLSPGDTFNLTSIDDNHLHLTVAGVYKDPNLMTGLIIPSTTLDTFAPGAKDPQIVLVSFDSGPAGAQAQKSITQALKSFPSAKVQTNAEYKKDAEDFVNGLLMFLYILLAMCLIISLIARGPTNPRLIAAIAGPSTQLAAACRVAAMAITGKIGHAA